MNSEGNRKLKALLVEHGIPRQELAKKLGISYTSLVQKLNGHSGWWLGEASAAYRIVKGHGYEGSLEDLFSVKVEA